MKKATLILAAGLALFAVSGAARAAETLHFVIMSPIDAEKERPKYEALSAYLRSVNPLLGDIKLRIAKDYPEAAQLFKAGDAEGMFSGSFVAAVFIAKGVAKPVARPLAASGVSTYRASIVAKEGTKPFGGIDDLRGKRVAYTPLASAGEVFLRGLLAPGEKPESVYTPVPSVSHQAALEAVAGGAADYAVVKSTVFAPAQYPGLALVGSGTEEHPDNTFIMPPAVFDKLGALIAKALLGLEADTGEKAAAVKQAFGCTGFIATAGMDFAATFALLRKARVDPKTFDFLF
jgi:ABC-type phosphate/phosphonate transport system substrate-binding protein